MIPDYCEAITAYRAWSVYENGLLVGQAHSEPWPPYAPFVGRCASVSGEGATGHIRDGQFVSAPVLNCDCGVHALKSLDAAAERQGGSFGWVVIGGVGFAPLVATVWGAVKLWGRLIEHEAGYRAEFAYPSMLYGADQKVLKTAAELYGVPWEVREAPTQLTDWYWSSSPIYYTGPSVLAPVVAQPKTLAALPQLNASDWQKRQAANPTAQPKRKGFRDTSRFVVNVAS